MLEPDRSERGPHLDVLEHLVQETLGMARSHLLEGNQFPLLVVLEGSGRVARMEFDVETVAQRVWAHTRTRLLATALAADAGACAFPSSLILGSGRTIDAVTVMAESQTGFTTKLAGIRRHWKTRAVDFSIIETPLANNAGTDPSSFLSSLIKPCSPAPYESEAAWRGLAMLGVEIANGPRSTQ
jgi:hypothetical protein